MGERGRANELRGDCLLYTSLKVEVIDITAQDAPFMRAAGACGEFGQWREVAAGIVGGKTAGEQDAVVFGTGLFFQVPGISA